MLTFARAGGGGGRGEPLEPARVESTGQQIAIRLLPRAVFDDMATRDHALTVERRARLIHNEHVAGTVGLGTVDAEPALAFQPVVGPSLGDWLRVHGPYPWADVRLFVEQVAQGLSAIHAAGLLHGNLTTANVRVPSDGLLKLTDVGLDRTVAPGQVVSRGSDWPRYAPPEGMVDERSDLYSLGVLAYELLTATPFPGLLPGTSALPPAVFRMPLEARDLVGALLSPNPSVRPPSAASLVEYLHGWGGIPVPESTPAAPTSPPDAIAAVRRSGGIWLVLAASVAIIALAGVAVIAAPGRSGGTSTPLPLIEYTPTAAAPAPTAATPAPTATERESAAPSGDVGPLVAKTLDLIHAKDFQFSGRFTGSSCGFTDNDHAYRATGSFAMNGADSDFVIDGVPSTLIADVEIVRAGDTVFRRNRDTMAWSSLDRFYDGDDSLADVFAQITTLRDVGTQTVAGTKVHRLAALEAPNFSNVFDLDQFPGIWDVFTVELRVTESGRLVGMEMYVGWAPHGGHNGLTLDIVIDKLSGVTITAPSVSAAPTSTPLALKPLQESVVSQVLSKIRRPNFEFEGPISGTAESGSIEARITGSLSVDGNDSHIATHCDYQWLMHPEVVRVGDAVYRRDWTTGAWDTIDRNMEAEASLIDVLQRVAGLVENGSAILLGQPVHRLSATGDISELPLFFDNFTAGDYSPIDLEFYVTDAGKLVGMNVYWEWSSTIGSGHWTLDLGVVFDKLSGVTIIAPKM